MYVLICALKMGTIDRRYILYENHADEVCINGLRALLLKRI